MKPLAMTLQAAGLALLAGCSHPIAYTGSGRLIDNGWTDPDYRYVVELGTLDLTKPGSATFRIAGLPKAHYVVGLQLPVAADQGGSADSSLVADVALQLMRVPEGQVLIITGPLRNLTWTGKPHQESSFVYRRELYESYFDAEPKDTFELRVVVNVPDGSIPPGSKVVLKSGGWK
ncbi:MAG: hypothetical protein ACHQIL_00280 [Steroidobacterales bacterium]